MPEQRQARLWIAYILGGAAVAAAIFFGFVNRPPTATKVPGDHAAALGEASSVAILNQALRAGDPQALAIFQQRVVPLQAAQRHALSDDEAAGWIETLSCLRTGFFKYSPPARATAAMVAGAILDKFTPEPAPARWTETLAPVHDIFSACLADTESNVRFIVLGEVSRFWVWMPGRSLVPVEEDALGRWKESLHQPVIRCLAIKDVRTRIAAIDCLGHLPIDAATAPAIAYLEDNECVDARRQTLVSFAHRPNLLTVDLLLTRLHDSDSSIRETATLVLRARGLNQEQISLGGLIVSPKPQQRASVISLIKDRTDIDPIVWLLQLSQDVDETVRARAVEALAAQKSQPASVKRRIAEMGRSDSSEAVRKTARKFIPATDETASLPPLPSSLSLNPKAN